MLHYETIPVTPFQQNCSVVWEDEGMTAAIIDPGGDLDLLQSACKQLGVTLVAIWITHVAESVQTLQDMGALCTHATSVGIGDVQYVSFVSFKGLPLQGLGSIESGGSWW